MNYKKLMHAYLELVQHILYNFFNDSICFIEFILIMINIKELTEYTSTNKKIK